MKNNTYIGKPARWGILLLAAILTLAMSMGSLPLSYGATKDKVSASAASKIKISKKKATLTVGSTLTLKVTGTKAKIKWSSSNKEVATVSAKGKVKAVKAGKVTIKAKFKVKKKTKTLKCVVTVNKAPAPNPAPAPAPVEPVPEPTPVPIAKAEFAKAAVKLPSSDMDYSVNYITAILPAGSTGYSFTVNGNVVQATPILTDGSLYKIPVPDGATAATVAAKKNGSDAGSASLTFVSAGLSEPKTIYGTAPMKFSEYFHDVTADSALPASTAFPKSGAVASPKMFITQGTRTGNAVGGVDTLSYARAEDAGLPYVDAVSTATYGDAVHFAPDANLILVGDRNTNTDPDKAITGIAAAEVGVPYDLYANAVILKKLGKSTAQSRNVLSKLNGSFTLLNVVNADGGIINAAGNAVSDPDVYKPKLMLTDGNWGARTLVNNAAAKNLPGLGNGGDTEGVTYGGNWGDKMTGFSFGNAATLGADYSGANYWDNFANYIYGGVITDSEGHSEPLVFLQNLFTHLHHEDFDVAVSPSRFSRLSELKSPDTYTVTVFADGFKDVTFSYDVKNYSNAEAAIDGAASVTAVSPAADSVINIKGLSNSSVYTSGAKLFKGTTEIHSSLYTLSANGTSRAKLTLKAALFTGSYQGSYSLQYENAFNVSKPISFSVINPVGIKLTLSDGGAAESDGDSEAGPLAVSKSGQPSVWLAGSDEFAKTLVTSGRSGFSTIQTIAPTSGASAVVGAALVRADASSPYRIDISGDAFAVGNTYKLTLIAPGFNTQTFYIQIVS